MKREGRGVLRPTEAPPHVPHRYKGGVRFFNSLYEYDMTCKCALDTTGHIENASQSFRISYSYMNSYGYEKMVPATTAR